VWAASDTFAFGDLAVGIRSDPAALASRVRAILSGHAVEGLSAPSNYSIRLETPSERTKGPPRGYALYRGRCLLLRTRKRTRALRALVRCLSAHTDVRTGIVRVRHAAVVGRSRAVLLPPELSWRLEALEPRMRGEGLWLADPPLVEIDTESGEVVLAQPELLGSPVAFGGGDEMSAPAGRYPIGEWAILGPEDEPVPLEVALAAVMPLVQADMSDPAAFDGMLRTLRTTTLSGIRQTAGAARLLDRIVGASAD
jgi:hypothetical protein